ncbi:MAG: hypothetical protein U5J99_09460 [Parvularculaceae bacterium]|nr:hypothetical protein [Parvularculaceae bacterium]
MLQLSGAKQAELSAFIGLDETIVSKMVNGRRTITADDKSRMEEFFARQAPTGFAEAPAAFQGAAALSPIYRSRSAPGGEWIIERAGDPVREAPAPPHASGYRDLFGFSAPDDSAWPRYKIGEIVWVSPSRPVAPGNDALIGVNPGRRMTLKARLGEFVSATPATVQFREYASGETRQIRSANITKWFVLARDN